MDNCNELLEKFYKSTNDKKFKLNYNWNLRDGYKYYPPQITGVYDGTKCNMDIKIEEKLKKENCLCSTIYSDCMELTTYTYCEVKKN
jgi:hypothetical protein